MRGICHAARQLKVELKSDALRQAANVQKLEALSEYALIVDAIGGRISGVRIDCRLTPRNLDAG